MSSGRRESPLRRQRRRPLLAAIVSMSAASFFFLFSSSPLLLARAADVAAKLPSGSSSGFMPFTFGGVHSQKEKSPVFLEEATEPRYVVEVSSKPKKKSSVEGDDDDDGDDGGETFAPSSQRQTKKKKQRRRTISLADRSGRPFECTIPILSPAEDEEAEENAESSNIGEDDERAAAAAAAAAAASRASENLALSLLRPLEGTCLYRIEDSWWTYEFCFERHVRQFHKEPGGGGRGRGRDKRGAADVEFWLGKWLGKVGGGRGGGGDDDDAAAEGNQLSRYNVSISSDDGLSPSPSSFISSVYRGGDPCDLLGGEPREAEVKFVCHEQPLPTTRPAPPQQQQPQPQQQQQQQPQQIVQPPPNVVLSAKELSTCKYEVVVGVAGLCGHPEFRDKEPETATIECAPVVVE